MIDPPVVIDDPLAVMEDHLNQQERRKLKLSTQEEIEARREHHLFAKKATEWLTVKDFATAEECVEELRSLGYDLWVTDLSQHAECLTATSPQIPEKVALVMGTEAVGCSQYMLDEADKRVYLPLRGYADSLNLSVATALIIQQLFIMDPTLVGAMSEEEKLQLRRAWYGKLCQQRLLTPSQRKARSKLQGFIKKCHAIEEKSKTRPLQPSEQHKLDELASYEKQLEGLESALDPQKVQAAIQEWVENPPAPLTDIRRADEHRVCYVGKNTRSSNKDNWKDMAATANVPSVHMSSAKEFRERVQSVEE
jgi:tRNA(Leu) C34 or U34 (ribose-2'-O)-methylase TrmL